LPNLSCILSDVPCIEKERKREREKEREREREKERKREREKERKREREKERKRERETDHADSTSRQPNGPLLSAPPSPFNIR
jgi:hypothetical protein